MRLRQTAIGVVIACGTLFAADLLACGDKFLMPTRATRFARPPAPRVGEILIYANPASELARALNRLSVPAALHKAGYRATLAGDASEFRTALNGQQWDLVLLDLADVQAANTDANRRADTILPVSYSVSGDQFTQARRQFPSVLKAPNKARTFLDAVDSALQKRRSEQAKDRRP